jgi:hypothetical protein
VRPIFTLLVLVMSCAGRYSEIVALPAVLDGGVIGPGDEVMLAVVGSTEPDTGPADGLARDIAAHAPDLLLLPGGIVRRGGPRAWLAAVERWHGVAPAVSALAGGSERRCDRRLLGFHQVFEAQGVPDLGGPVTFSHLDIVSAGVRWRLVMLDSDRRAMGDRWHDQLFWLPKVITPGDYDHLLVVLDAPLVSLADARHADPAAAVSALLDVIVEYAGPTALMGVFMGGGSANEIHLPGGSFGEAHVVAGNGAVHAEDLWHRGQSDLPGRPVVQLVDGFDAALRAEMTRRVAQGRIGPLSVDRMNREAFPSDVLPIRGWWEVVLDGRELALGFHLEDGDAYDAVYRIRYTRSAGWVADRDSAQADLAEPDLVEPDAAKPD